VLGGQVVSHRHDERQSTPLLQAPLPQVTEQGPAPHVTTFEHEPTPQVTEQLDAVEQSIGLRHVQSLQCTVQGPKPQIIGVGHAPDPVQVMSQLDARVQSTLLLQALMPHETRHGIPAGQTTIVVQLPDAVQSNTQTSPSQRPAVQAERHARVAKASGAAPSRCEASPRVLASDAPPELLPPWPSAADLPDASDGGAAELPPAAELEVLISGTRS